MKNLNKEINKISMISTLPPLKGMSPYTLGLVKELSKEIEINFFGFKSLYPEFLYPGGTKTSEQEPKLPNLNIKNTLTWYNPFSWIYTGFKIKDKIIHVQWWSWFLAPVYITTLTIVKLRGKKVIMTIHNVEPHEKSFIKNFLNTSVISLASEYIVHSEDNKKKFEKYAKNKKINVLPIGLEEKKQINRQEAIKEINSKLNSDIKQNDKVILFFGNIRDYKGLDVLIEVYNDIKKQNNENNSIKLIVAGESWEKQITELIKSNKDIIFSNGFIPPSEVVYYFSASDLVVFPYKYFDASSAAASDAISYGKAIVVTKTGGLPTLVKDKNVIAVPNSKDSLKKAILYTLYNNNNNNNNNNKDKNKIRKLEQDSKSIASSLSWKSVAKKTLEVYRG
ncbi:MAG TPA: glycosyltransferase [Candidatus Nanoarchaeia archaeon]|nr:glycosyltransferase [Candidatus Nanoarchaeia archaeon]